MKCDALYQSALVIAHERSLISAATLQRQLMIGFNQAKALLDALVTQGILSVPDVDGMYPSIVCAAEDAALTDLRDVMVDIPIVYISGELSVGTSEGYYVLSPDDTRVQALNAAATRTPSANTEMFSDGDIFFLRDESEITWLSKAVGTLVRPYANSPADAAHVYAVSLTLHARLTPPLPIHEVDAIIGEYPDGDSTMLAGLRAQDGRALLDFIVATGRLEPSCAEKFRGNSPDCGP